MNDENEPEPEIIDLETMKDTPILKADKRLLSVPLTEEEVSEFGEAVCSGALAIDEIEGIEKARASKWRAEHKVREAEQLRIVKIRSAKAEDRQVEVKWYAILDDNVCLKVRTDTGEVLDRRALKVEEVDKLSQQPLPLSDADEGPDETYKEDVRAALEPPTEPAPTPKGARDLVEYIERGRADDALDTLKADTRKSVKAAVKARREVLAASELPPEAGESEATESP